MSPKKSRQPNPMKVPLTYINKDVYDEWKRWCKSKDLIQQRYMSNVITFILGLDNSTRLLFLGEINEKDRAEIAKLILKRIANDEPGEASGQVPSPPGDGPIPPDELVREASDSKAKSKAGKGSRRRKVTKRRSKAG